jgi:hypothetical protein
MDFICRNLSDVNLQSGLHPTFAHLMAFAKGNLLDNWRAFLRARRKVSQLTKAPFAAAHSIESACHIHRWRVQPLDL